MFTWIGWSMPACGGIRTVVGAWPGWELRGEAARADRLGASASFTWREGRRP